MRVRRHPGRSGQGDRRPVAAEGRRQNWPHPSGGLQGRGLYRVWLHDGNDDIAIVSIPVGKYPEKDEGAKVCVSSWRCG
ncbi:MAG: hypothetical protein R3A10_13865 [Caldilineaceae bacterium]